MLENIGMRAADVSELRISARTMKDASTECWFYASHASKLKT